jgi:hypothetical protein
MAPLPFYRQPSSTLHLFDVSAIDVAGPYYIKIERSIVKRWLLVICCATVGAIHCEMIDSMDTSSFLLAIERFLAVRPPLSVFLTDNGTNFRGGKTALENKPAKDQIDLEKAQEHFNLEFRFAPPKAPHFQGLVKRFVGAAKAALRSAVRAHTLTDKELRTVFSRAMGHLNNIPIANTVKSDADSHYQPLTPSHFLMGSAYNELQPEDSKAGLLSKAIIYNRVCKLLDVFWKRLLAELSTHLRSYNTWISKTRGVKVRNVAFLLHPTKRGTMPLVKVTEAPRDIDGHVRQVMVWDRQKTIARAITSLAILLPADQEDTEENTETRPKTTKLGQRVKERQRP